jgi:hypothetical protein
MDATGPQFTRSWGMTIPVGRRAYTLLCVVSAAAAVAVLSLFITTLRFDKPAALGAPLGYLSAQSVTLFILFLAATGLSIVALRVHRIVARNQRSLAAWSFLPAAAGYGDRLHLEKYRGDCPSCGSALRFYNKPVRWHTEPGEGGTHTVVDERHAAVQCRDDESHWWHISETAEAVFPR